MVRTNMLEQLKEPIEWDIIIIGGGATGLGAAVDAASRGYKTLLVEQHDFAKGTSSRSTKLVHGGVRYLQQGNIKLIREALKERGLLLQNAPHVCQPMQFVLPVYSWYKKWYYGIGLMLYDFISDNNSLGKTTIVSARRVKELLPAIRDANLKGGILYYDGRFDDARLAVNLAQTAAFYGATILNYCKVVDLIKKGDQITGISCRDKLCQHIYKVNGKVIINATGVFTDSILQMESTDSKPIVSVSQGVHIVIDNKFFPGSKALMVPETSDGRVLFAVPWNNKIMVGTTDTPVEKVSLDPIPLTGEIDFIIEHFNKYSIAAITRKNILSVFAGLRPLVSIKQVSNTSILPRDHVILVSKMGLVTITGGKWTTYRKMAQEVVDKAIYSAGLPIKKCRTEKINIHGFTANLHLNNHLHVYGADIESIQSLAHENAELQELIHPGYPYIKAQIKWAVQNEMAMTVEDFLARRIRLLFLDARAAIKAAPLVAEIMGRELGTSPAWGVEQVQSFNLIANTYLLNPEKSTV